MVDMGFEKTTTFAGLVWVAGVLAMILFRDAFTGSGYGIVLGLILAMLILVATYFVIDGIWKIRNRQLERENLQRQAYEDKMVELVQDEMKQMEEAINDTTMRTAKLLVKYTNKTSKETMQKLEELEQEIRKL
ncbi:MAG: hypothetical protein Q4D32_00060 [Eubacteriales bacterium]|nr:hypothetical protein [Eubacteriales bacterium]